jgi:urate oxidase
MSVSDMAHAYYNGSNKDMTATDTHKNLVYYVAKQMSSVCSAEEYAIALAKFFVKQYPKVYPYTPALSLPVDHACYMSINFHLHMRWP